MLTKEVLPPRLAPRGDMRAAVEQDRCMHEAKAKLNTALMLCAAVEQDRCVRGSCARALWASIIVFGILNVVVRYMELWSW